MYKFQVRVRFTTNAAITSTFIFSDVSTSVDRLQTD